MYIMKLSLRPRHLIAGALFWVFLMSLMTPYTAGARTMLQIGDGMTLSFSDGDIDVRSGSGELHGVEISENGEVALMAEIAAAIGRTKAISGVPSITSSSRGRYSHHIVPTSST